MPTTGAAELALARGLGPWLMEAEAGGTLSAWFFTRKRQQWRIRYLPTRCGASQIKAAFTPPLTALRANGHLDGWYEQRYEAELLPFGGAEGMELAHRLFHRDSRALFAYLRALADGVLVDRRREVSTLLSLALLSGAGLDWYERGDVWARVARHRPVPRDGDRHRQLIEPGLRVLLRSDLEQATTGGLMPAGAADWVTSFRETGAMLAELADTGKLRRGLRAVLAHHLLFHFNRAGISGRTQGAIAAIAMEVTFE